MLTPSVVGIGLAFAQFCDVHQMYGGVAVGWPASLVGGLGLGVPGQVLLGTHLCLVLGCSGRPVWP